MTRVLFDTSVLVAAMLEEHPHHSECFAWLQRVRAADSIVCCGVKTLVPASMRRNLFRKDLVQVLLFLG